MKKILALVACLSLVASLAVGGSIAYLQDQKSDVNVMALGKVEINQIELERKEISDTNITADNLQTYSNPKSLYPAVGPVEWAANNQEWATGGSSKLFTDKLKNVQDKFVFIENFGKSNAYVRNIILYEAGTLDYATWDEMMHFNRNETHWTWADSNEGAKMIPVEIEIDGKTLKYYATEAVYAGNAGADGSEHKNGVLPAGATTRPSLLQVFLDSTADNDICEKLDGNGDGVFDIIVMSQAVQTAGFEDAKTALDTAFGVFNADNVKAWMEKDENLEMPEIIDSAEELRDILTGAGAAGAGDTTIYLTADVDLTGQDWTPINVDGYHGADVVTINGNGKTITGLNAPLFMGGFAGGSGIVIKNLTIADSEITSTNTEGSGAFIEEADSMSVITLENCHLLNSTVTGTRTGGLIGWTSGYSNVNDGPVKTYVTITDCSVIGSTITGSGSVGAINGHAGASDWTYTTIKNCTVKDCTLTSTDTGSWRVGVAVGTANAGEVTIEGITATGNTLSQTGKTAPDGQSNLYGRFVPAGTGKLVIDGTEIQ